MIGNGFGPGRTQEPSRRREPYQKERIPIHKSFLQSKNEDDKEKKMKEDSQNATMGNQPQRPLPSLSKPLVPVIPTTKGSRDRPVTQNSQGNMRLRIQRHVRPDGPSSWNASFRSILDLLLCLVLLSLAGTTWMNYVYEEYLLRLYTSFPWTKERKFKEHTYYYRQCSADDVSTTNPQDLYAVSPTAMTNNNTTNQNQNNLVEQIYHHHLKHVFPSFLKS